MYFAFQISVRLGGGRGQTPWERLQNARKPPFSLSVIKHLLKTSWRPVKAATRPFCGASTARCGFGPESGHPAMFQGLAIQYPTCGSVKM